jgi:Holliday junction DNA helicase RuvA
VIAQLRGRVVAIEADRVVVEAGGVGYEVFCHLRTLAHLHEASAESAEIVLHIQTEFSQDSIRLFGFTTVEELRLYRLLRGVERIGPKAALAVLGRAELPTLVRAIREGDEKLVATVPGVGPKTAAKVILDLRGRLDGLVLPGDARAGVAAPPPQRASAAAIEGLQGLGFRPADARSAVAAAAAELGDGADVNDLVAVALRRLDLVSA